MKGLVGETHEIGDHARGEEGEEGRPDRDPEIEPEAHPVHVEEIVIELAADTREIGIGRLENLGETRESWPYREPLTVVGQGPLELGDDLGRSGLGPIRLISPRRTLISWGSSSRWLQRKKRPTGVTRLSPGMHHLGPSSSLSRYMERIFRIVKGFPFSPSRCWV